MPHRLRDRRIIWGLLLMSFGTGAADAFAFLGLGDVFTANMTGNMVLVGLFGRPDYTRTLIAALLAIVVFSAFVFLGFRLLVDRRVTAFTLLYLAAMMQGAVMVVWMVDRSRDLALVLLALSAAAMGLQSVVAKRLSATSSITTTFMTGTMANLLEELAHRRRDHVAIRLAVIVALIAGAFAGALVLSGMRGAGGVLPFAALCVAMVLVRPAARAVRD